MTISLAFNFKGVWEWSMAGGEPKEFTVSEKTSLSTNVIVGRETRTFHVLG